MNAAQANKQAARESKTQGARYVVWVFDQGRDVYSREQVRTYSQFLSIESLWVDGVKVADSAIATQIAGVWQ
jgi:hypothetical protein